MTTVPRNIDERSLEFACAIVLLCEKMRGRRGATALIVGQLLRSGTSVGSNLAEARAGQSRPDFISKCHIALKEARESQYWLRILARTRLSTAPEIEKLTVESGELIAILTAILKKTKSQTEPR